MSALFAKLNLKDQREIFVLNAPASFEAELLLLEEVLVKRTVGAHDKVSFAIAFATTQTALDAASATLAKAADGDAVLWFAYPKGKSKRYTCEFNRDSGWSVLGDAGFEGVRQVSIDEDWSALRFRAVGFIKSFTRAPHRASSALGKARANQ
jgi:hypothetical protein